MQRTYTLGYSIVRYRQKRATRQHADNRMNMTNSSAQIRLLEAARKGHAPYALLKEVAIEAALSAPDLLDDLSYFVASQYSLGKMDFEEGGVVMNALWAVCFSEEFWADHDRTIPCATSAVYLPFHGGEYYRKSDPPDTDPEIKYTRPLIEVFLARQNRTG